MAPEIRGKDNPHNYKIDVWALGVVLYELLKRKLPFKGRGKVDFMKEIPKIIEEQFDDEEVKKLLSSQKANCKTDLITCLA